MPENNIDLTPLDPTRDKNRFDRTVALLTSRILAARRVTPIGLLTRAFVPIMGAAMALALILSVLLYADLPSRERTPRQEKLTFANWARGEKRAGAWEAVEMLKGVKR